MKSNKKINKEYYNYVIYHRNCFDGFSGFIILTKTGRIHDDALIYPDVPSAKDCPPNITGKNIIIIDVAYKKEILEQIIKVSKKVTFIDHHISIHDDILALNVNYPHEIIYDERKSGSMLTWEYFYRDKPAPKFLSYINDNDIGAWILKNTMPFITGLEVGYKLEPSKQNIYKWRKLFDNNTVYDLIETGKIYNEYKNYLLEENYRRYSMHSFPSATIYNQFPNFFKKEHQYRVAVTNSTCPQASQLGVKILEKVDCDFVIMWNYNMDRKEYILSWRSKKVDVASIAKLFNGGGHTLAAACSLPGTYKIDDLFGPQSLPRTFLNN